MNAERGTQTVLITGATDGLGKEKKLPLESLEMDVWDDNSVKTAVASIYQRVGTIDVLINNAGLVYVGAVEDLRLEDWRRQFETNFFGVIRVTQAVLPPMRERRKGRILMMSSVSGFVTAPTQGAYSASKHAIEALSNALRHELYPFGIHTILIQPGYIVTNIQPTAMELAQTYQEKFTNGPYAKIYASYLGSASRTRAQSKTTPEDCARIMLKAMDAPRPKARYGVTSLATFAKWAKWLLTDSSADRLIRRRYGIMREG